MDGAATATAELDETSFLAPLRRRSIPRRGVPGFVVLGVCASVLLASFLGLGALLKLAGR